jgi:hypothetical protein
MVMVGVTAVELEPQEFRIDSAEVSAKKKKTRCQRTLPRPKWKFCSSTRNPPARSTLVLPMKIRLVKRRSLTTDCGKSTFCHPERSEGSAFLLGIEETADSSSKPRNSE